MVRHLHAGHPYRDVLSSPRYSSRRSPADDDISRARPRGPESRLVDLIAAVMLIGLVVLALGLVRQAAATDEPLQPAGVDHHVARW
jgi:hypothetical protein